MAHNQHRNSLFDDSPAHHASKPSQPSSPPLSTPPAPPPSCLFLSEDVIRFEPVSEVTAVFFDESNSQLIISRSNGAGGIVVKSEKNKDLLNLRLQNLGDIGTLNFSPDSRILAIKRTNSKAIDFVNVYPGFEFKEFSQSSKFKKSRITGPCWVNSDELAIVSTKGLEYYQVFANKKLLKLLKTVSLDIHWHLWKADSSLCLVSTGNMANVFYAFHFKDSTFSKMTKIELEVPSSSSSSSSSSSPRPFKQRDFMLLKVYNTTYLTRTIVEKVNCLIEVHLYAIKRDVSHSEPEALLLLGCVGRTVLSVVDNLIILHHHSSKTSHIYDIGVDNFDTKGGIKFHLPIISPLSIRPFTLNPHSNEMSHDDETSCELYSSHWAIFNPDVILDAKKGFYWNLKVDLQAMVALVDDKVQLTSLLLLRSNSQSLILKVCRDLIEQIGLSPMFHLGPLTQIFDKINSSNQSSGLSQLNVFDDVILPLHQQHTLPDKFLNSVILEYILSLSSHQLPTEMCINELLIERLLRQHKQHQLQQMLQYRLFQDSKALAIRLLSMSPVFPAANQLALDMLRRLSTSLECIFELLLSCNQVLSAIRYAQTLGLSDQLKARKFLEVSMTSHDDALFYVVYHYFEDKNTKNRGQPAFLPADQCDQYVDYYKSKFSQPS